jgi:hypothetical protein
MSATNGKPGIGRGFAFGALAIAWASYVSYFFLPVVGPAPWGAADSSITGLDTFLACFVIPLLWPVAGGHVLFWLSSVLLALGRWRGAAVAGLLSLALGVVAAVMFLPPYIGMYCKLLAIAVVSVFAIVAAVADAKRPAKLN